MAEGAELHQPHPEVKAAMKRGVVAGREPQAAEVVQLHNISYILEK
jgi:hypothetical protein